MRTIDWRGTLTATSSIAHTGREAGNRHGFRRETLILPDGRRLAGVPVISGGVIRGDMRRRAAAMMQHGIVGDERLPFSVVHALRTGGALRETRAAEEVLTSERQALLRDLIPMLAIFGFSTSGRIVSGRLEVDKPIPVARETLHLIEHYGVDLAGFTPPSIWELIQVEDYTRFADVNDGAAQPYIIMDADEERSIPKGSGDMIYSQESLLPGTRLFHSVVLNEATPVEVSFMDELMTRWQQHGRIGAQKARGLGRFTGDLTRTCRDVLGDPAEDEAPQPWREHVAKNRDAVMEVLGWL